MTDSQRTLTIRTPEDLLALVPLVLGFEPEVSLVMLTVAGPRGLHVRLDLPEVGLPDPMLGHWLHLLVSPSVRHGVQAVVLVFHDPDAGRTQRLGTLAVERFSAVGITVATVLRVHDGCWFHAFGDDLRVRRGTRFDVSTHPFRVAGVVAGRVIHATREDWLADRLAASA